MTVDEQVRALVEVFKGHRYGHSPDVPDAPGSYPSVLVNTGTLQMDCTSLTTWAVMALYPAAPWTPEHYQALQIWYPSDWWGGVRALEDAGVGHEVADLDDDHWHWLQTKDGKRGHSVLVKRLDATTAEVIEANKLTGVVDGVHHTVVPWPSHFRGTVRLVRLNDV